MAEKLKGVPTRTILSSEAKANFGQVIDDVFSRGTRYVIQRFDTPRAVLISLADYQRLLTAEEAGVQVLGETRATYHLGQERTPEEIAALLGVPHKRLEDELQSGEGT